MKKSIELFIGILAGAWYSYLFPLLFPVLYINLNLNPVFSACKESFDLGICRMVVVILLWVTNFPVDLVVLLSFVVIVTTVAVFSKRKQPDILLVLVGYILFALFSIVVNNYGQANLCSWHTFLTLITHSVIISVGLFTIERFTKNFYFGSTPNNPSQ